MYMGVLILYTGVLMYVYWGINVCIRGYCILTLTSMDDAELTTYLWTNVSSFCVS